MTNITSDDRGAGIVSSGSNVIKILDSKFSRLSALDGGVMYLVADYVWLEGNEFTDNKAKNGGVLFIY